MKQHHARTAKVDQIKRTSSERSQQVLFDALRAETPPFSMAVTAFVLLSAFLTTTSHALPQNPAVVAGSATITQPNSSTMTVNQSSANAIINWNGYSIGANESVKYVQPGSSSVVLNRVTGVDSSTIYGQLSGNGQVWVINPNGLLVGSGATIQTGSFLASTMNISNENFMSGKYAFATTADSLASIINQGTIRATDGGYVVLAAPSVSNAGSIAANLGSVHLASGDTVLLGFDAGNLINVAVNGDVTSSALGVANSGHITANGGQVVLTARVAGDIMKNIVNNDGIIEAKSIVEKNGFIVLDGGDHGITANSGSLDASGRNAGESGGKVTVIGDKVGLFSGASVDVSGAAGGGTTLIGGNIHGSGPEKNASQTYVDKDAAIQADALANGAGGTVVVWSNDMTRFGGSISARGGIQGGDGGTVEVSGRKFLDYRGSADLRAPNGRAGTLLLDPDDVFITSGAAGLGTNLTCTGGTCDAPSGSGTFFDTTTTPGSSTTITDGTIDAQLALGNVTVTASGTLNAASGVVVATNGNTLNLTAGTSITLGGTYSGGGTLKLNFGTDLDLHTNTYDVNGVTAIANGGGFGRISGPNETAAWNITGADAGALSGTSGTVTFSGITALAGGSLTDTLTGPNSATSWNISGANAVTINGLSVSGMNALVGGPGSDSFTFGSGVATFGGTITGGGGSNTLAATDGTNVWQSTGTNTGTFNTTTFFSAIANLAGGTGTDTLTGQNAANAWSITGANAVTLDGMNATGMEVLAGRAGADTFTMAAGIPTFNGSISGGGGTDTLAATDGANAWVLTGANSGTLNTTTTFSGITTMTGGSGSDTLTGTNQTYMLDGTTANKGNNGTVLWNSMDNLSDTAAGIFNFGTGGSVTGGISAVGGTLNYGSHSTAVTVNLAGSSNATTGIGGSWSGITTVIGSTASDTISSTAATYNLNGTNAGNSGAVSWTSFENLTDSGAGTINFRSGSSLTGSITSPGGTLDYSAGIAGPVTFNLSGNNGATTGIGGSWSGITTVTGSGSSDTISGTGKTYTLSGANAGSSGGVSWTSFEKIADAGTGSIATSGGQTYTLSGVNSGSVTTLLPGGYSGIGNLTDTGAGSFRFTDGSSLTGTITAPGGTLDYSGMTGPVAVNLTGKTGSGIGGSWSGITTVTGSGSSDTISGTGRTYTLSGANAGSSGGVSWTSFEKIADAGTGSIATSGGQTYTLSGVNSGSVTTLLPGGYSGIGNLTDSGAGTFRFGGGSSLSGSITAVGGTLDYSAGSAGPVTFNLSGSNGATTGIGGGWSGITTVTGSGGSDTISGTGKTYTLSGANAGSSGGVSWTSFEKIADAGTGSIATSGGQTYTLSGVNSGSVTTLLPGGYSGIGNLTDSGAGTFR
ncbi:MAG: filamentous hemagglutinin N-terminal domain-containing protein, partial [Desulfuromonadaceae bacterium]|nr:filamentous hemagglutinin N-terminal domain-containing protein [Desulfuromonadaceae bacterium]